MPPAYPELFAIVGGRVPNYQGYFLRGVGGNSAGLGQAQGDAIRNITGEAGDWVTKDSWHSVGAIELIRNKGAGMSGGSTLNQFGFRFDASRVVPTAEENRPVNKAVRYFVRALP